MTEDNKKLSKQKYEQQFKDKGRLVSFRLTHEQIERMNALAEQFGDTRTGLLQGWIASGKLPD